MELGEVFAGAVVEEVLSGTLARARTDDGPVWIRTGPATNASWADALAEAWPDAVVRVEREDLRTVVLFDAGQPAEQPVSLDAIAPGSESEALRGACVALLDQIARLHGAGATLRGLDPDSVRTGRFLPMVADDARWSAPEGAGEPEADLYAFGLLVFWALTGTHAFAVPSDRHEQNGSDPRDIRASSPPDLAAIVLDLLLVEPDERPPIDEIRERLTAGEALAPPSMAWLAELEASGGVLHRAVDPATLRSELGDEIARVDGSFVGSDALVERVMGARALTRTQRGLAGTALKRADVLAGSARSRAGALLGQALHIAGVRVLLVEGELARAAEDVLEGLVRTRPTPAVVVSEPLSPALSIGLVAAGERVADDPGSPEEQVLSIPLQSAGGEGLDLACATVRSGGPVQPLLDALGVLDVPVRAGWWGRTVARASELSQVEMAATASDATRARAARKGASHLAWVEPERAALLGRWCWRQAHTSGDRTTAAFAAAAVAMHTGELPELRLEGGDETTRAGWTLTQAVVARVRGRAPRVVGLLDDQLPLPGAHASETAMASLLLAEARMDTGAWLEAVRMVRRCRVDARRTGNVLLDVGALCLGVQLGLDVHDVWTHAVADLELHGLLAWWRVRADIARRLGDTAVPPDGASFIEIARLARAGFEQLGADCGRVMGELGAVRTEARMWVERLEAVAGGPIPRPSSGAHPLVPAWLAIGEALAARREGDVPAVLAALKEAEGRSEGAGRSMVAAVLRRLWGLFLGGNRGGNAIAAADRYFAAVGAHPVSVTRQLVPELAMPSRPV